MTILLLELIYELHCELLNKKHELLSRAHGLFPFL
jgi:hypothetical protein